MSPFPGTFFGWRSNTRCLRRNLWGNIYILKAFITFYMGFGKDGKGQVLWDSGADSRITLGTLASLDVISKNVHTDITEDFRILKTKYFMQYAPGAFDAIEGPLLIGMAPGAMTSGEIEQAIEANPDDRNDIPDIEFVDRMVWPLEVLFSSVDATNGTSVGSKVIAQGEFTPKWTMPNPDGWTWWAYNFSQAALADNGFVEIIAKHFGVWVV